MSREIAPFGLRMPKELREALQKSARQSKRSLNAEIVVRLEQSLAEQSVSPRAPGYQTAAGAAREIQDTAAGGPGYEMPPASLDWLRDLSEEQRRALFRLLEQLLVTAMEPPPDGD